MQDLTQIGWLHVVLIVWFFIVIILVVLIGLQVFFRQRAENMRKIAHEVGLPEPPMKWWERI